MWGIGPSRSEPRSMIVDGYVRVSEVAGRRGERFISPAVQREDIERWAAVHGALVGRLFEELDESGGRRDRPLLQEAIGRVESGDSDGLVVAYLSRFGRSLVDGLEAIKRITDAGGAFVSVQEGLDFSTDTGRLLLRVMLSIAEWELDRYRSNWRVASERAVARGVFIGGVPFGYRRVKGDGRLRVDRRTGRVVTELFRRRAEGARYSELRRWLMESGIKTATGRDYWNQRAVGKMLSKRVYLGEARYLATVNTEAHPPLTDPETWRRAQFTGVRTPMKRVHEPALLWGLARCAYCRRPLIGQGWRNGPSAEVRSYKCHFYDSPVRCPSPVPIRLAWLDPYVEQLFWQQLAGGKRQAAPCRLARLEEALRRRERELVAYRDNPHLPVTLGAARFAEGLRIREQRAERARTEFSQARSAARPPALPAAAELKRRWSSMTPAERRAAIAEVIDCVFVWRGGRDIEARTCALPRGRAPAGLPDVGQRHRELLPPFDRTGERGALRLRAAPDWGPERVRKELAAFVESRDRWPSFDEFQAQGRALLWDQVQRHGGNLRWASAFELPYVTTAPDGHPWTDERIRVALAAFLYGKRAWPTWREFEAAGLEALRYAINASGGAARWAGEMGVELRPKQRPAERRWTYARMKEEVAALAAQHNGFPTPAQFQAAGLSGLYQTITKKRLRRQLAADLGLRAPPIKSQRTNRWTHDQIKPALDDFLAGRSVWPTRREFQEAGLYGLLGHLHQRDDPEAWARRYGLAPPARRLKWTEAAIKRELDKFLAGRETWPRHIDFRRAQLRGLEERIAADGTREAWMRRYGLSIAAPRK
jgi:site-specific DNA recombinase